MRCLVRFSSVCVSLSSSLHVRINCVRRRLLGALLPLGFVSFSSELPWEVLPASPRSCLECFPLLPWHLGSARRRHSDTFLDLRIVMFACWWRPRFKMADPAGLTFYRLVYSFSRLLLGARNAPATMMLDLMFRREI